ncbi:hypothetical protein PROFUN_03983 [Planoprotostelium fungivorum]|uniref:Methyltransferase domain-containing protein n=1 Tax=Planoprotostelium fungivorum TaxID=1890364 RepID=A0A2P6NW30_9EUKA|nr:hypothetical protein PROFUN_03983 [Planoprotostelium fungivorum]
MTALDAEFITKMSPSLTMSQTRHRVNIIRGWGIEEGSKLLELGCGQGDCTAVLAAAVGPLGHVTAVDPGSLDYGSPMTLGQAQKCLKESPLGSVITFHQADPIEFLQLHTKNYDAAILVHCIWYFSSPEVISYTLQVLAKRVKRIYIAEYALSSEQTAAMPHIQAVLTQASLECRKEESTSNVRTVASPSKIREIADRVGLSVISESIYTPEADLEDGRWETNMVLDEAFTKEVDNFVRDEREKGVVMALRDATQAAVERIKEGRKGIRTMDVWVSVLEAK